MRAKISPLILDRANKYIEPHFWNKRLFFMQNISELGSQSKDTALFSIYNLEQIL